MEVPSKNSLLSDMGRRPQLKSDEFFEGTPLCSRDNRTFVFETAQESGSVIGGATPLEELHIDIQAALSLPRTQCNLQDSPMTNVQDMFGKTTSSHVHTYPDRANTCLKSGVHTLFTHCLHTIFRFAHRFETFRRSNFPFQRVLSAIARARLRPDHIMSLIKSSP